MPPTTKAKKARPWWVEQRRFVVPATLQPHIQNLAEEVQVFYCFIVSKVVIETKKRPRLFRSISSKYFKNFIGSEYLDYLRILEADWRIIEINDSYWNGKDPFCKGYRLHPTALAAPKVKRCFRKKQVQPRKDKSKLTDDVAEFVHNNLKRLTVRTDLLPQVDVADEVAAEDGAEVIHFEQFNVHYSDKAKRLYHAVIAMPKVARKNLILKADPTIPLFEYDVKSCTPVILLGLPAEAAEKDRLKSLVDGDIYTAIATEAGVTKERDDIKDDFMLFLNGAVRNYVYTYFATHLPSITEQVLRARKASKANKEEKTMAWFGQGVEARIMSQEVPRHLMYSGTLGTSVKTKPQSLTCGGNPEEILYIPMHDGWLGIERDEQRIAATVREEFHRRLHYWVTITKKELATGKETTLVAGAPKRGASVKPKIPAKAPSAALSDAKSLRRTFRVPSDEQVKKTAKRLFKVNQYGQTVADKKVLAELRTFAYKKKLARELEDEMKKLSPESTEEGR